MSDVISGHGTTVEFFLGSPAFNPKEVDDSTECAAGAFKLDTTKDGKRNTGRAYSDGTLGDGIIGRALNSDERSALMVYLKSL